MSVTSPARNRSRPRRVLTGMPTVNVTRSMQAPRSAVWAVLADFPNISAWNSGVTASHSTSEAIDGVGARRHCDLAPIGELEETITAWQPEEQMVVSIDSARKLPIRDGLVTFSLRDEAVDVRYDFTTKYGPAGKLMAGFVARQLEKGFAGFLEDLDRAALAHAAP